jgi:hypothetical protein
MELDIPFEVHIPVPVSVPVPDDDLIAEVERLRAELAAMQKQRDEARRIVCIRIALDETKHYMGTHGYPCLKGPGAMEIASERGWDCFKEGGGA